MTLTVALAAATLAAGCSASFDPEVGRKYPCTPGDGGSAECPGNFRCGLEGFCRDPAERGAFLCNTEDDCPKVDGEDWHCGIPNGPDNARRCYDRLDAGALPCRYDAGVDDCAPDWKCGVIGRCHDQTPASYACLSDSDCEGGWRCGLDGACHDAALEGLPENLPLWRLQRTRVSPQLPADPVDFTTAAPFSSSHRYAWVDDGGATLVRFFPFGASTPDGGVVHAVRQELHLSPAPRSVVMPDVTFENGEYYEPIVASGGHLFGLYDAFVSPEGKLRVVGDVPPDAVVTHLDLNADLLMSAGEGALSVIDAYATATQTVTLTTEGGMPLRFTGFGQLPCPSCDGDGVLAATDHGLYQARRGPNDAWIDAAGNPIATPLFVPVSPPGVPNAMCGGGAGTPIGRIRADYGSDIGLYLGVELPRADGSADLAVMTAPYELETPAATCSDLGMTNQAVCPACPPGGALVEFAVTERYRPDTSDYVLDAVSVCNVDLEDGGTANGVYRTSPFLDGGCVPELREAQFSDLRLRATSSEPGRGQYLDRSGNPWLCGYSYTSCYPELLSYPPAVVMGDPDDGSLMAFHPYLLSDGGYTSEAWRYEPGVGMAYMIRENCLTNDDLLATVNGAPQWILTRDGSGGVDLRDRADLAAPLFDCPWSLPAPIARLQAADSVSFEWPDRVQVFAQRLEREESTFLFVAAGDRVWMGDLTARLKGESDEPVSIPVRLVPQPFARIERAVVLEHGPLEPEIAAGYLVINGRLFRFDARDPKHLDAKEVLLPDPVVNAFVDGQKGRVATTHGDLYALPIPVALGEGPLAPDDPVLQDADALCGDVFGIGAKGLYRLEPDRGGASSARWQPITLPGLVPDDPLLASFAGARFHRTADALYVITARGLMYRLGYDDCARAPGTGMPDAGIDVDAGVDVGDDSDPDAGMP